MKTVVSPGRRFEAAFDEAIGQCQRAIDLKPNYAEACVNLGNFLASRGDIGGALAAYRQALEKDPRNAGTLCKLAALLIRWGELEEATAVCRQALECAPHYADAHNNLGVALKGLGKLDEAAAAFQEAVRCEPQHSVAHNNLGNVLCDQGRMEEALEAYRQALRSEPGDAAIHSNLIFSLQLQPGRGPEALVAEMQGWNRKFAEPLKAFIRPHGNDRTRDRRLRIGYVSPDFRNHPVGLNLIPLFRHHDHAHYEIVCYSDAALADELTEEFRRCSDQWRETAGLSDEAVAELIRRDAVDILVDLSQHSSGNRLLVFAR